MEPLRHERSGDTLTVVLSSPHSSLNVFGPPMAAALDGVLRTLPSGVRTLVLRSDKPGSFVNGAGLLYAHAMGSPAVAKRVSAPVRAVYERLARCPLRTVAVIEGNCFGCGLELALCCKLRVGRELVETQFRMTELTDYRFIPLFGGTWRLPRRVGVAGASELLLEGKTWSARRARDAGLLDALLPNLRFEEALESTLRAWAARPPRRARAPKGGNGRLWPLARVPPTRRALWRAAGRLLMEAGGTPPALARAREVSAFAATVSAPACHHAMSFFFVRHMARSASLGSSDRRPPRVGLKGGGASGAPVRALVQGETAQPPPRAVTLRRRGPRVIQAGAVAIFFPLGTGSTACELAAAPGGEPDARELARFLEWRGLLPVVTRARGPFASERLLAVTAGELRALAREGHTPRAINQALWNAGFEAPPRVAGWRHGRGGRAARGVVARMALAWVGEIARLMQDGTLFHVSQGDVLVEALFGFPLEEGGLLSWADRRGLNSLFEEARRAGHRGAVPKSLEERSESGRRFYA